MQGTWVTSLNKLSIAIKPCLELMQVACTKCDQGDVAFRGPKDKAPKSAKKPKAKAKSKGSAEGEVEHVD